MFFLWLIFCLRDRQVGRSDASASHPLGREKCEALIRPALHDCSVQSRDPALFVRRGERPSAPRVASVSSLAHRTTLIDFDDLEGVRSSSPWKVYGQSKLAMLMFAPECHRRFR
jgi:hypothetical protein